MTAWWVVVNPAAGRGRDLAGRVNAALDARGIEYVTRVSESAEAIGAIIAEGRDRGYDSFASVGGDGTANLVANRLFEHEWPSPPTLGILPAGSGSDFVRSFAIPNDLEGAADHLIGEARCLIDVGLLTGAFGERYFINAANAGIAARTVLEADRFPDLMGSRRYLAGFWSALARTRPDDVRVDCDGVTIAEIAWNVVVANGRFFGGGMNVAPTAEPTDGRFDVQVFSGPRTMAPVVIRRVIRGTHLTHPLVLRITGRSVVVDVREGWLVEADGEIIGKGSFRVDIVEGRLRFKL